MPRLAAIRENGKLPSVITVRSHGSAMNDTHSPSMKPSLLGKDWPSRVDDEKPKQGAHSPRQNRRPSLMSNSSSVMSDGYGTQVNNRRSSVMSQSFATSSDNLGRRASIVTTLSEDSYRNRIRLKMTCCLEMFRAIADSKFVSIIMFLLTVYALFGDDLRLAIFNKSDDFTFNVVTIVSLALFASEVAITSLVKADYFGSFFFYLDVISTLSLVLDITIVWELLVGYDSCTRLRSSGSDGGVPSQSEAARAGRSGRVGTRVARILRVLRLVRVARVFKLWMALRSRGQAKTIRAEPGGFEDPKEDNLVESNVGKKLSEKTTMSVIFLVLAMLVMVPVLSLHSDRIMMADSPSYGADVIDQAWHEMQLAALDGTYWQQHQLEWEKQLLMFIYYHNYFADCAEGTYKDQCAGWRMRKLCFVGYSVGNEAVKNRTGGMRQHYIKQLTRNMTTWENMFSSTGYNDLGVGSLPTYIKESLARPWEALCPGPKTSIYGVSFIPHVACPEEEMRLQETTCYVPPRRKPESNGHVQLVLFFDLRKQVKLEAMMNAFQTVFIILVLTVASAVFSKDIDELVLYPIERMITKVKLIRLDPLYAIKLSNGQCQDEFESRRAPRASRICCSRCRRKDASCSGVMDRELDPKRATKSQCRKAASQRRTTLETKILENMIIKLGSLLALGFGEAGSETIGRNLGGDNVEVDPTIPGRKVEAIYGFCKIRNFTLMTEVLQERTMVFVNQVANIVHHVVNKNFGAANKNLGDAFLLVWQISSCDAALRSSAADHSLMSFIQVIAAVVRDPQLATYRTHPALVAGLGNSCISLGFGLHLGWSIEGAIGSQHKIDASYVSSDVTMAASLEASTLDFNVSILLSDQLVRTCSASLARSCRPVDRIKYQGAKHAIRLFTVDLDVMALEKGDRVAHNSSQQRAAPASAENPVFAMLTEDPDIRLMRASYIQSFFQKYETGYLNYEDGEWDVAAQVFLETRDMLRRPGSNEKINDGPSIRLLMYMGYHGYVLPAGWPGYREPYEHDETHLIL